MDTPCENWSVYNVRGWMKWGMYWNRKVIKSRLSHARDATMARVICDIGLC